MSVETADATKPVDDAKVVHDDPVTADEKVNEELVADVTKLLEQPDGEPSEKPGETKPPETPKGEAAKEGEGENGSPKGDDAEDASLSKELQSRAKGAGLTEDLARRLHRSGQLEETLAAFDRGLIEQVQSKEDTEDSADSKVAEPKESPKEKEPPPKDPDVPALDPEVHDEELVKRDAYQQQRIDALEKKLESLSSHIEELIEGQQGGFDEWFDGVLDDLGCDTADEEKCQSVFKAYGAMCDAFGANVHSRDSEMVKRAYAAMYPQDVFREKQRQTVDRLRDAQGKFLSSPTSKGGPPPKGATDEEVTEHLVSKVTSYLKEEGVQMSGV